MKKRAFAVLRLLRPHHSIKNILILLPLVFSGKLFYPDLLITVFLGFIAFSLACSAVYAFNDVRDVEKDRIHPTKCKRPIADGTLSVKTGIIVSIVSLILSLSLNFLCTKNTSAALLLLLYLALNLAYSFGLKAVPIADIVILSAGFLIRVMYGSTITGIPVSNWLYLTVISVSFYLGLGKRRGELVKSGDSTRGVLRYYNYAFLDKNMYICNALFLIFYALWCTSADISEKFSGKAVLTVPLVLLISMKYSLNVETVSDGDPVEVLLSDKLLLIISLLYGISMLGIIYL